MSKSVYSLFSVFMLLCGILHAQQDSMIEVESFGSNPGNLSLFYHVPKQAGPGKLPLVVVLHGCSESVASVDQLTGWSVLADRYGFYVLFPKQRTINNVSSCFNWFKANDTERGKGECESIHEMIGYMSQHLPMDTTSVFITGLSAGAAMSTVMMAVYPECFKMGAVLAGGPYKAATNAVSAMKSMLSAPERSAAEWAALVREQNPSYHGKYPDLLVVHGDDDKVVNISNAYALVKQWTALCHADTMPVSGENYQHAGIARYSYADTTGHEAVVFYEIEGLGHALPIDPGTCRNQGGQKGVFGKDIDFYSTFYVAEAFGLIPGWRVKGRSQVKAGEQHVEYTIQGAPKSSYAWSLPEGCRIEGEVNKDRILVNWSQHPGTVSVTETDEKGCIYIHAGVRVDITGH